MSGYTKIIHFMWIDPENKEIHAPPPNVEHYMNEWQQTHPEWKILFWNMKMCETLFLEIPELTPFYHEVFDSPWMEDVPECIDPSFTTLYSCPITGLTRVKYRKVYNRMAIADLCRLAVVYVYGGVYLDLSMNPLKGLDLAWQDYPSRTVLYCREPVENWIGDGRKCLNSLIGARFPGNTFWLDFLKYICETKHTRRKPHIYGMFNPVTVTGPYVLEEWSRTFSNPDYKPLDSCAFARRPAVGGDKLSRDCNLSDGYAEKIWAKSTKWGTVKTSKPVSILLNNIGYIGLTTFYFVVLLSAIVFLGVKGYRLLRASHTNLD